MQNDVCAKLERCFHTHLMKVEKYMLIENQALRGGPTSMICDITVSLEANSGPIFNLHKCDVETFISSAHSLRTE